MLEVLVGVGAVLVALLLYQRARRQSCWKERGIPWDEPTWRQRLSEALAGEGAALRGAHRRGAGRSYVGLGGGALLLRDPGLARRLLAGADRLPGFVPESHPLVVAAAAAPVAGLRERPDRLDAVRLAAEFSAGVVASAVLGAEPTPELVARLAAPPRGSALGRLLPCLQSLSRQQHSCLENILNETLEKRRNDSIARKDLIHYLLEAKEKSLNQTPDNVDNAKPQEKREAALVCQALELAREGLKRTSWEATSLLAELAQDQEAQQRAREEVLALIGKYGGLTVQALEEARFLHACFTESVRLHPAAESLERVCLKELELEEGVRLPAGTRLVASLSALGQDPDLFEQPLRFRPGRASADSVFLPSSTGAKLSELAVKTFLAVLLKNFQLSLSPESLLPDKFDHLIHEHDQIFLNLAVLN